MKTLHRRTHGLRHLLLGTCCLVSVLGAPLRAQDKGESARLAKLLTELKGLPTSAWDGHIKELDAKITAHEKSANELRKKADKLRADAAAEDMHAKGVRGEIERLRSLMALVEPAKPAKSVATKTAPATKAEPKKAEPMKAEPMKAEPMKAMTANKAEPKNKDPKKVEAKKTEPTKAAPKTTKTTPAPVAKAMPAEPSAANAEPLVAYEDHILPILEANCMVCHDEDEASGGLNLESFSGLMEGGSSGATVVPGDPEASRLYLLVAHREKPFMPRDADKLPKKQIELIRQWIAGGAAEDMAAAEAAARKATAAAKVEANDTALAPNFEGPPPMPAEIPFVALAEVVRAPAVKTIAASPRAPLLAVAGHGQILLHDTESLKLLGVLPFPLGQIETMSFTLDGGRLLVAGGHPGQRGGAVLYDVTTGQIVRQIGRERDSVLAAAISPGQSIVAIGGPSRKVRVFETTTGDQLYEINAHNDWILSIDISPNGNHLATADRAGVVGVWEADTGRNVHMIRPKSGAVHAVRFRPDGKFLAVATEAGTVQTYDLEDAKQKWSQGHGAPVLALAWASDQRLATGGTEGRVKLWKSDGGSLATSPALGEWVYTVAFDHTGERLFAGDWRGQLQLLDKAGTNVVSKTTPAVAVTQ